MEGRPLRLDTNASQYSPFSCKARQFHLPLMCHARIQIELNMNSNCIHVHDAAHATLLPTHVDTYAMYYSHPTLIRGISDVDSKHKVHRFDLLSLLIMSQNDTDERLQFRNKQIEVALATSIAIPFPHTTIQTINLQPTRDTSTRNEQQIDNKSTPFESQIHNEPATRHIDNKSTATLDVLR